MSASVELVCQAQSPLGRVAVRSLDEQPVGPDDVLVRVLATSVNPIDAKRASGYGRRVLSLLGAAGPTLNLGNDFAGEVLQTGRRVNGLRAGDRVFGVLPTGRSGAHRSQVVAPADLVRLLPPHSAPDQAAILPYTFCTLWRALKSLKLDAQSAAGKRVLVQGGGSALGQLAIQLLSCWGAAVTVVASARQVERCLSLGAVAVIDRHRQDQQGMAALPADFDASLNFGSWSEDAALMRRLQPGALGHATAVHPLMSELDQHGWLIGALHCAKAWWSMRRLLRSMTRRGRYVWVVFKPDPEALDVLADLISHGRIKLDIGLEVPFTQAARAFEHVAQGHPTRAVLVPPL